MKISVLSSRSILLCFLLLLILIWNKDSVSRNIANIFLNSALGKPAIEITERQKFLTRFLKYQNVDLTKVSDTPHQAKPTQALFIGEHYRLQGNLQLAARWYKQVIEADLPFDWVLPIGSGWYKNLESDGDLTLFDFSNINNWVLTSAEERPENIVFKSENSIAELSYDNNYAKRDMLAYSSFLKLQDNILPYYEILSFRVKVDENSFFTVETVVDGERQRRLHYYEGSGDWETFSFNLSGNSLDEIKLIISEPDDLNVAQTYTVYFDWIKLEMIQD
ncbi:MAG: hypothetical protein CL608_07120 [Anaerolineaceae bacterium]|nr:hypothetical protein [Anaerolineaceae bacterium]